MKSVKFLSEAKYEAKKTGQANIDIGTKDDIHQMLEVVKDPQGNILYFHNDKRGRGQISESEADKLVLKSNRN